MQQCLKEKVGKLTLKDLKSLFIKMGVGDDNGPSYYFMDRV